MLVWACASGESVFLDAVCLLGWRMLVADFKRSPTTSLKSWLLTCMTRWTDERQMQVGMSHITLRLVPLYHIRRNSFPSSKISARLAAKCYPFTTNGLFKSSVRPVGLFHLHGDALLIPAPF